MIRFTLFLTLLWWSLPVDGFLRAQTASDATPLTRISEIRDLRQTQAEESIPVQLQGTVLFYDCFPSANPPSHMLFITDATGGIYVHINFPSGPLPLAPGEKIVVSGRTQAANFAPIVLCDQLTEVSPGTVPGDKSVSIRDVLSGREDCSWVAIEGIVREDNIVKGRRRMVLAVEGARVPVYFAGATATAPLPKAWEGTRVIVRGVVSGIFNNDGESIGVRLFSPASSDVQVLVPVPANPFSLPATRYENLADAIRGQNTPLQKVVGTVTYDWPGHGIALTDGKRGLMVKSTQLERVAEGETVEALGFPDRGNHSVFLEDAFFHQGLSGPVPAAKTVTEADAVNGQDESELATIHGQLMDQKNVGQEQILFLRTGDTFFAAQLPLDSGKLDPKLTVGDTLAVTGILNREDLPADPDKPGWHSSDFQLLLRSPQDVALVQFWTTGRLVKLSLLVAGIFGFFVLWIAVLRRHIARQQAVIEKQARSTATLEERNRIARELHDTLAQGFAGTAFLLEGIAPALRDDDHHLRQPIEIALRMVRHSLTEARRSLMNLRADALEHRDLVTALEEGASDMAARAEVELHMDFEPLNLALSPVAENNFFRIGMEAVSNALQHARAKSVQISLRSSADSLTLCVRDDGSGFDVGKENLKRGHFGLLGMRERAQEAGADLEIASSCGAGTVVTLRLVLSQIRAASNGKRT